jgi:archaemetzincin
MRVIKQAAEYMRAFYDLPVVLRDVRSIDGVTPEMVRKQYPNNLQIRTTYFIDNLLPKMLPDDAAALICFTSNDLFPGDTWNYVFGQASLEKRVGVWSLWRLEKDGRRDAADDLFLDRTLKVSMHETGHMFSMRHCTKYECLMSGTNHLGETDRRPLDTCPECTMKIAWAMKYPAVERYRNLAEFWKKQARPGEEKLMLAKGEAIRNAR